MFGKYPITRSNAFNRSLYSALRCSLRLYVPIDAVSPEARLEIIEAVDGSEERAFHTRITTANKTSDRLLAFGPNAGSLSNLVKIDWHAMGTPQISLVPLGNN